MLRGMYLRRLSLIALMSVFVLACSRGRRRGRGGWGRAEDAGRTAAGPRTRAVLPSSVRSPYRSPAAWIQAHSRGHTRPDDPAYPCHRYGRHHRVQIRWRRRALQPRQPGRSSETAMREASGLPGTDGAGTRQRGLGRDVRSEPPGCPVPMVLVGGGAVRPRPPGSRPGAARIRWTLPASVRMNGERSSVTCGRRRSGSPRWGR